MLPVAVMSIIVKICGITQSADALAAADAGADALGFMFYERSPRHITISAASAIIQQLPPQIVKVGVFVNAEPKFVLDAITECGLNLLQFHGQETPEFCTGFGIMSMKAFQIRSAESLKALSDYPTDAWLLDAYSSGKLGGTGERFDWDLAVQAREMGRPIFLAGGLTPENVAQAIRLVQPYGVDVSSGVESSPGRKDPDKVRRFVQAAKNVT
jgi:phosphoribosylanthranilate isomerase